MNGIALIIAILGAPLFAACSWSDQTAIPIEQAVQSTPKTAPPSGPGQASNQQSPSSQTGSNANAQPGAQPYPTPQADAPGEQGGKGQTQANQPGTNRHEDNDLDRIPAGSQQTAQGESKQPATNSANGRIYLENAFTLAGHRGGLVVPVPQVTAATLWQERLFLDVRRVWRLDERLNFTFSNRLNLRAQDDIPIPDHEDVVDDFREGFLSWRPRDGIYLDIGRINVRSGAALGFNPTDFFKSRAVVEPLSADPSVLREDRLGTLILEAQYIGQGRALTLAVAPALVRPTPIYTDTNLLSFNPSIDRTNDHVRILAKGSLNIGKDFNPELLFFHDGSQTKFGANITRGLGQKVIAYAEWAGGEGTNLIDEALRYARETGTLPENAPSVIPDDKNVHLQNDLAVGASYTTSNKITFNLEYHLHEAGFSRQDWNNWFESGRGQASTSPIARELWYIREYALYQQAPLARQSTFLRADWVDAIIPKLELAGFMNTDVYDGSSLIQASADYYISRRWTLGAQVNANLGSKRSDFGSLPQSVGMLFKLARYF
jgi:hypothetical protein